MMRKKTKPNQSAGKVLDVLNVLLHNFSHGYSNRELAQETGYNSCDITRYVNTLEQAGFAERITETGRIRPSHKLAQKAVQIMRSLEQSEQKIAESKERLFK